MKRLIALPLVLVPLILVLVFGVPSFRAKDVASRGADAGRASSSAGTSKGAPTGAPADAAAQGQTPSPETASTGDKPDHTPARAEAPVPSDFSILPKAYGDDKKDG